MALAILVFTEWYLLFLLKRQLDGYRLQLFLTGIIMFYLVQYLPLVPPTVLGITLMVIINRKIIKKVIDKLK